MDELQALDLAGTELERRLAAVRDSHLDLPSSCSGWSVYDLVNHVNGGGRRYLLLMRGGQAEDLVGTRTEDHVRPDPLRAFRQWQQPLTAAFAEPGALGRVAHHPAGDRSGLDLLRMRVLDLTLHAWDLARSLGLDDSLAPELTEHLLSTCLPLVDKLRGLGLYGAVGQPPTGVVSSQHELLRQAGRS